MANGIMPPIGRSGVFNAVRKLSDMPITGWRDVDASATFVAGQVAKLATVNGKPQIQLVSATSDKAIGIFISTNTTYLYRPVYQEVHTFGENAATPTVVYINPYVKASSYVVENVSGTPYTETTDYTLNTTSGAITNQGVGIGATATIYVRYLYKDVNLSGINQVLSGKVALFEGVGELATLAYDTASSTAYVLNAAIYKNSSGYLTATSGGTALGFITKIPTVDDPELHVKLNLV